uniref:Putative HNH endonuclease n=1 Tax=viral metagenome TaxID=1070528 RepID=A0A6M3IPM3_9ZZZZ
MENLEKQCPFCGRSFIAWIKSKEYCSTTCASRAYFAENREYLEEWRRKKIPILNVECRNCGKIFETQNSKKIFCSNDCKIEHFNAIRPTTKEEIRECPVCKKIFRPMQKTGVGRTYCTDQCRNKAMNEKRWAATQGKNWDHQKRKWKGNWFKALERDSFTCQICKRQRKPYEKSRDRRYILEVHHKDGTGEHRGLSNYNLDNLTTLCAECHREFHTKINLVQINGEYFVKGRIFDILGIQQIKTLSPGPNDGAHLPQRVAP